MNSFKFYRVVLLGSILVVLTSDVLSQKAYSLNNYLATINGTSNVHEWSEKVGNVWGNCNVRQNADKGVSLLTFKIGMEVKSITSDKYPMMSGLTCKALKGDKYPEITFYLMEPLDNICCVVSPYCVTAKGRLCIAGVNREIIMPMKFVLENNKIIVEAEQKVKMTEYGVTPPTAFFGLIRTGNVITINFKTTFLADNK